MSLLGIKLINPSISKSETEESENLQNRIDALQKDIKTLETKYDDDAGDWYVALGWNDKRAIIKMDSVQATITEIKEI